MSTNSQSAIRHNPSSIWPVPDDARDIYSHAVETFPGDRVLYVSGQIGVTPKGALLADFEAQCAQAISNLKHLLEAAKMDMRNIVKVTFYLTRSEDLPMLKKIRKNRFRGVSPAVTTLIVASLAGPDLLVEIDGYAAARRCQSKSA